MNKVVRISTSLLLSLFILVSGSGLIIGKMVCLKSGYVQISANEAKDCCTLEEGKAEFADQCCAISNLAFQQQQFLGQNQQLINSFAASTFISFPDFLALTPANSLFTSPHFFPPDPPDLVSGSSALPCSAFFAFDHFSFLRHNHRTRWLL